MAFDASLPTWPSDVNSIFKVENFKGTLLKNVDNGTNYCVMHRYSFLGKPMYAIFTMNFKVSKGLAGGTKVVQFPSGTMKGMDETPLKTGSNSDFWFGVSAGDDSLIVGSYNNANDASCYGTFVQNMN